MGCTGTKEQTRINSKLNKEAAVRKLYELGCYRQLMLTLPGPNHKVAREEEDEIRAHHTGLVLDVVGYEMQTPMKAQMYGAIYGEITEHALAVAQGRKIKAGDPEVARYNGIIIDWDGESTHTTNKTHLLPLKDTRWNNAVCAINTLLDKEVPVVLCYTHVPRDTAPPAKNPTDYDQAFMHRAYGGSKQPWEAALVEELTEATQAQVTCLWSSRNYWLEQRALHGLKQQRGTPYRWAFYFNPQ